MAAAKQTVVEIQPIDEQVAEIIIRGKTPLVVHAWSEKAKRMILDKQRGKKLTGSREVKIPRNDFADSLYWLTEKPAHGETDEEAEAIWLAAVEAGARFGFPVTGIKQSIISGAYRANFIPNMASMRGTFYLEGATDAAKMGLAEIVGPTPIMREDMVMVGAMSKTADIRYRAEFEEWEIPLRMRYNAKGKYTLGQILNCIDQGGFGVGIGEWRPERDGDLGTYELVKDR